MVENKTIKKKSLKLQTIVLKRRQSKRSNISVFEANNFKPIECNSLSKAHGPIIRQKGSPKLLNFGPCC